MSSAFPVLVCWKHFAPLMYQMHPVSPRGNSQVYFAKFKDWVHDERVFIRSDFNVLQ